MTSMPLVDRGVIAAPHIVVLGAGASIAAYIDWGKVGDPLPSLQNIVDVLDLRSSIQAAGYDPNAQGFEDLYSDLAVKDERRQLRELIEERIQAYFSSLKLPDAPTIYDYLVLGLREKDIIATFNWDPFLLQAYMRNEVITKTRRPLLSFLHGNVLVGVCEKDHISGIVGRSCSVCGEVFVPSKLLYPIKQKDYSSDPFIKGEWSALRQKLSYGYYLTMFGYSAPKTDIEARELMLKDWKENPTLNLAEVDIIDIKDADELEETWQEFFVSHHYGIQTSIFDSYLFKHPRRSCDAFAAATLMLEPWHDNPFPRFETLGELQKWVQPLIVEEEHHDQDGTPFSGKPVAPNVVAK